MRRILGFWWSCIKTAARGNVPAANDWQWLIGFPVLGALIWIINRWFGEGTVSLSQDTAMGALEAAAIAFVITWSITFLARLSKIPMNRCEEAENRAALAERRIAEMLARHAHFLRLMQIDQEDRRQLDPAGALVKRHMRFMLRLRNAGHEAIRYAVTNLDINGVKQGNVAVAGGVIQANSDSTYYSHWIDLPVTDVNDIYNVTMVLEMEYGHPDRAATRIVHKKMNLELLPANQGLHMLYEMDTDDPSQPLKNKPCPEAIPLT